MLGLEVKHNHKAGQIHISQCTYIDSILRCFSFDELKLLSTPFDTQVHLMIEQALATAEEFAIMHDVPYREAVSTLNCVGPQEITGCRSRHRMVSSRGPPYKSRSTRALDPLSSFSHYRTEGYSLVLNRLWASFELCTGETPTGTPQQLFICHLWLPYVVLPASGLPASRCPPLQATMPLCALGQTRLL